MLCVLSHPWPHAVSCARDLMSVWPRGEKHTFQSHRGQVTYSVSPSGSYQGGLSKVIHVEPLAPYLGHR